MKHILAILIKFMFTLLTLGILLGLFTQMSFLHIITVAVTVTVLSYILGDLIILRFSNNFIATLGDAIISFLTIYLLNYIGRISFTVALISSLILAVFEWFFHRSIYRRGLIDKQNDKLRDQDWRKR